MTISADKSTGSRGDLLDDKYKFLSTSHNYSTWFSRDDARAPPGSLSSAVGVLGWRGMELLKHALDFAPKRREAHLAIGVHDDAALRAERALNVRPLRLVVRAEREAQVCMYLAVASAPRLCRVQKA